MKAKEIAKALGADRVVKISDRKPGGPLDFWAMLDKCEKEVKTWPAWKRNIKLSSDQGRQLSWSECYLDMVEVGGSTPLHPTTIDFLFIV